MVPHISFNKVINQFVVAMIENTTTNVTSVGSADKPSPISAKKGKGTIRFKKAIFKTMENNEEMKTELYESGLAKGYADIDSIDGRYRFKIGIIDFLTNYNTFKLLENQIKSTMNRVESTQISAIDQESYQKRFI